MAEWSNAAVLKTVDLKGSGGSNPSLSAKTRLTAFCEAFSFKLPHLLHHFCGHAVDFLHLNPSDFLRLFSQQPFPSGNNMNQFIFNCHILFFFFGDDI